MKEEPGRIDAILGGLDEPLLAFDRQRVIFSLNEAAERLFGYERGGLNGASVDVLVPPRFRQADAQPPAVTPDITVVELPALRRDQMEVMTVWHFAAVERAQGPVFLVHARERSQVIAELETTTYAAVFEASPVPIALSRAHDRILVAINQAFADLFELRREDFVGRASANLEIATPEQREEIGRLLAEHGAVRELECERRTVTGRPLWVSLSVTPVRIGGVEHHLSTVQDISHRKAQELALATARAEAEQERQKLRLILMQAPIPICMLEGPDHTFTFANPGYVALVGGRDVLGKPLFEALPDIRNEGFDELLDRVRTTGEPFFGRAVPVKLAHHAPGEELILDFVYQPIRDERGQVNAIVTVVTDVTEHAKTNIELKKTATALAESRARADYAVRLAGIGFWYCDLPFDELAWDARVKEHFFLPPDARVTIDTFYERIVPEDRERTRAAIEASIRDRKLYDVNYRTYDPVSGDIKWIRAMGGTSYAPDGTPTRFDGVTVDITPQKRDEERFASTAAQLEEANRVKDEFLAMLGHELRNPLSPITMAVQLLRLREVDARELDVIERQANHLTRLVDDLLDVSRITRGKVTLHRESCEMAEIIRAATETVSPLVESRQHVLLMDVPSRGLAVDVDRLRMVQVVSNLLTNAAKYTPARGQITVKAYREGDEVVVCVEDTGEGIPEELLAHVFDMFVQSRQSLARSQGGLGLGLAIVKSLVTMHGGSVSARSAGRGRGSTFTIHVPAATTATAPDDGDTLAWGGANGSKRVLVVDDNADGADMISEALRALGYQTAIAHDGGRALEVAAAMLPDVALVDIGLPVMDGYEVARRLRERDPRIELIAITGYGQPEDRRRSREAGFHEHLTKPIDLKRLGVLLDGLGAAPRHDGAPASED